MSRKLDTAGCQPTNKGRSDSDATDAYLAAKRIRCSPRTIELEEERLSLVKKHFGDVPLSAITAKAIAEFQRTRHDAGIAIRIDAKRQALDALDAARRATAHNGDGNGDGGADQTEIPALVEVSDDLTSQSRHSLLLRGSPPAGKLLIPLERRDVRVVEGARLENNSGEAHRTTPEHFVAQSMQQVGASRCPLM